MDATQVADVFGAMATMAVVGVVLAGIASLVHRPTRDLVRDLVDEHGRISAWLVAAIAMGGSLWFSESAGFPPCELCWYQRIAMYPLVLLLGLALFPLDLGILRYTRWLTGVGFGIAVYHNLLYYHLIPESLTPCKQGISCTTVQLEWLGFITIPLLSLVAFGLILAGHFFLRGSHEE